MINQIRPWLMNDQQKVFQLKLTNFKFLMVSWEIRKIKIVEKIFTGVVLNQKWTRKIVFHFRVVSDFPKIIFEKFQNLLLSYIPLKINQFLSIAIC